MLKIMTKLAIYKKNWKAAVMWLLNCWDLQKFSHFVIFSSPAPVVSVLADIAHYATSSFIRRNVRSCMTPLSAKICHAKNNYCIK